MTVQGVPDSDPGTFRGQPSPQRPQLVPLALGTALLVGLVIISRVNFLLFHGLAELISIAVAWSVFMLAWNAQRHMHDDMLLLLGISALFVGGIDLVHTLSYAGMNVFPGYDANLPTQLWIAARYLQSLSLLAAVVLPPPPRGPISRSGWAPTVIFGCFTVVTSLLVWSIFARIFPTCYVEGVGLTPFKRISEVIISLILVLAGLILWRGRPRLDDRVRNLLLVSIAAMVVAELAFTLYVGVYDLSNVVGHAFKVIAFLLLYQAVIRTGVSRPYAFLSQELQAGERRLHSIFRVAPTGIGLVHDRRILDVNLRICEMTGYSREELIGADARLLYPSQDDYDYVGDEKYRQIDAKGSGTVETRWQRKDGTIINVLLASTPLDPEDRDQGVTFTALDITQRELLLTEISEQAHRLQSVLDTVPEGVLLLDGEGRILLANPTAESVLSDIGERLPDGRLVRLGDRVLWELLSSPPFGLRHEVAGGDRTFEVISRPMESGSGSGPERFVLVINDVTREREVEAELRQQERLAVVGRLAAGIAHDFNNILAVIVLYAQMDADASDLPERFRPHVRTIVREAHHASALVQQILDFGRRAMLTPRAMDLVPFIEQQVELLARTLPESIRIVLHTTCDTTSVRADETRIQQLLTNLALNARDAMPEGGTLTIGVGELEIAHAAEAPLADMAQGRWVRLTVADTGTGMSPEVKAHLFEPFFTTKGPGKGSGLGLAQVYGIVKQHHGHIGIDTELDRGTTFTIYLPALTDSPIAEAPGIAPASHPGHGEVILIVEDSSSLRGALSSILEHLGYRALEAANGEEALAVLEDHRKDGAAAEGKPLISLVLSDVVMPDMGGQALFRAMQARGIKTPLIMMTGHPIDRELRAMQAQGLAGWLLKPIQMEALARLLSQALHPSP